MLVVPELVFPELVVPALVVLEPGWDVDEAELRDRLVPELPQAVAPTSASSEAHTANEARNSRGAPTVTPVTVARFRSGVRSAGPMPAWARAGRASRSQPATAGRHKPR